MTGPAVGTQSDQQGGGPNAGITFEEIERQLKDAEKTALGPKLDDLKLEGEEVPEVLRGKSAREALTHIKLLEDTLRQSEIARQQAMQTAQLVQDGRREAPPAREEPAPEPQITSEQVAAAFSEDAAKGVELMNKMTQQQIERAGNHFMQRITPMLGGAASAVEAEARRKYPDEFELYKDDITKVLTAIPDKSVMSTVKSWDDMIAYVRGQDPKRLFDHWQNKDLTKKADEARETQRNTAGVSMSSSQRAAPARGGPVMDETTREVCKVLGMSETDYVTWSKVS